MRLHGFVFLVSQVQRNIDFSLVLSVFLFMPGILMGHKYLYLLYFYINLFSVYVRLEFADPLCQNGSYRCVELDLSFITVYLVIRHEGEGGWGRW